MKSENENQHDHLQKIVEGLNQHIKRLEQKFLSLNQPWHISWILISKEHIAHTLLTLGISLCTIGFSLLTTHIFNATGLNPLIKIGLCLSGAVGCFITAFIFKKDRFFAQIIAGMGSFLLYLGLYAFFVFFTLFSKYFALIAMGTLIAGSFTGAFYGHLRIFMLLNSIGGFLAPGIFFYQTGLWAQQPILVGYLSFLSIGTGITNLGIHVTSKKYWPESMIISLVALASYFTIYLTTHRTIGLSLFVIILISTLIIIWFEQRKKLTQYPHIYILPAFFIFFLVIPLYWINQGFLAQFSPLNIIFILLYGILLYGIGIYKNYLIVRLASYGVLGYANSLFLAKIYYNHLVHPLWAISLHIVYACSIIATATILIINHYQKKILAQKEYTLAYEYGSVLLSVMVYSWGYNTIILSFDRLANPKPSFLAAFFEYNQKNDVLIRTDLTETLLTIYTSIFASILLIISLIKNHRALCSLAFIIFITACAKFGIFLISPKDIRLKATVSFILGIGLVISGIIYKKTRFNGYEKR